MESNNNDEKNTRALLDNLFEEVRSFQYAREVKALFEYCRRMQHLSAYNAALVYTQQPGNRLVLSAKQWYKENRLVKPNSRPLIILFLLALWVSFTTLVTQSLRLERTPIAKGNVCWTNTSTIRMPRNTMTCSDSKRNLTTSNTTCLSSGLNTR